MLGRSILPHLNSWLPHKKVKIPFWGFSELSLNVYLDTELGIPLGITESEVNSFFKTLGKNYRTFLDIGGFIGVYPLIFSTLTGNDSYVVEPHPENQERIYRNIELNDLSNNIHVIEAAATEHSGETNLKLGDNSPQHSLVDGSEGITVTATTIDYICQKYAIEPDFIKIDVEGGAGHVLRGAEDLLSKCKTDWLVEIHGEEEGTEVVSTFNKYDYKILKLDEHDCSVVEGGHRIAFCQNKIYEPC